MQPQPLADSRQVRSGGRDFKPVATPGARGNLKAHPFVGAKSSDPLKINYEITASERDAEGVCQRGSGYAGQN